MLSRITLYLKGLRYLLADDFSRKRTLDENAEKLFLSHDIA